ncbi:MAG: hypothetical protein QF752_06200 [Planctomycetota bacterium]|jgi:hypothetical protein|nr:hypothetical protein [Planctomycetota bacterium]
MNNLWIARSAAWILGAFLLAGCLEKDGTIGEGGVDSTSRVGLNFISLARVATAGLGGQGVGGMLDDFEALDAGWMRQMTAHDIGWSSIYQGGDYGDPDSYDFSKADLLFLSSSSRGIEVVPTLFQIGGDAAVVQGAPDKKMLYDPKGVPLILTEGAAFDFFNSASKITDYVKVVATRYQGFVDYYECANEARAYEWFADHPCQYALLLICVKKALQEVDPELKLVLGGLGGTVDLTFRRSLDWFSKVLHHLDRLGELDAIDVVNFHYYDSWDLLAPAVDDLMAILKEYGLEDRPIWATEIGSSYVPSQDAAHTEDASETEQARDVVRKIVTCFAHGADAVGWHTHISPTDVNAGNIWYGFGLRHPDGEPALSYHTFGLFNEKLGRFNHVKVLSEGTDHVWAYRFRVPQGGNLPVRNLWVLWSDGEAGRVDYPLDAGAATKVRVTRLVSDAEGNFETQVLEPSEVKVLPRSPILVETVSND